MELKKGVFMLVKCRTCGCAIAPKDGPCPNCGEKFPSEEFAAEEAAFEQKKGAFRRIVGRLFVPRDELGRKCQAVLCIVVMIYFILGVIFIANVWTKVGNFVFAAFFFFGFLVATVF